MSGEVVLQVPYPEGVPSVYMSATLPDQQLMYLGCSSGVYSFSHDVSSSPSLLHAGNVTGVAS